MPAKLAALSLAILAAVGCASGPSQKDLDALKAYNEQLERDVADLRKYRDAYDRMKEQLTIGDAEEKMFEDLRVALLEVLKGMKVEGGDVQFDPKTGKWTLAGDLLFDSGSYKLTPKGEEVLKKFAETYKGKPVTLRIVGHTDRDPIQKTTTKGFLIFDCNMELGAVRACSVFMTLAKFGLPQGRMFIESWGNNNPAAPNDHKAENKKKNRRVEIFVVTEPSTPGRR
jgi:chemotaxis protein MotB